MIRLRRDRVMWERSDDEVVCLDLRSSSYFTLNETGAVLWAALADGAEHAQLVDLLVATFDAPAEQADADVTEFMQDLERRELVETV